MLNYTIRRVLLIVPSMLLITLIIFIAIRLIPGSVVDLMLSQMKYATLSDKGAIEKALGLDVPFYIQYFRWLGDIFLHGDLGSSLWSNTPVTEEILDRFPVSFQLGIFGVAIALLIAIPVGVISAIRQDTVSDYAFRSIAIAFLALPGFWLGTMVVVFPAIWWQWAPPITYTHFFDNPFSNLKQLLLPAFILGIHISGITMRMTRTMMLEVLRQDYIRTSWAKGLRERTIIRRHALRNALIPIVTTVALYTPVVISGSVVIEQIFSIPGMGRLLLEALLRRDYPVISGINLIFAAFVLLINLVVDLTYAFLDPRIRYE